jgi:hypothetical protein
VAKNETCVRLLTVHGFLESAFSKVNHQRKN